MKNSRHTFIDKIKFIFLKIFEAYIWISAILAMVGMVIFGLFFGLWFGIISLIFNLIEKMFFKNNNEKKTTHDDDLDILDDFFDEKKKPTKREPEIQSTPIIYIEKKPPLPEIDETLINEILKLTKG